MCIVVHLCVGPVMDWQPVQDVPCLLPDESWDRLQPHNPTDRLSGYRKWMDGDAERGRRDKGNIVWSKDIKYVNV